MIDGNHAIRSDLAFLGALIVSVLGIINPVVAQEFIPQRIATGETVELGIGKYVTLLYRDGWFLWERSTPQSKECMAFKVAEGYGLSRFSEVGRPTGSAGFWLSWDTLMPDYESARFFGRHWHPRIQVAEIDGEVRNGYHSLEAVQEWDGRRARFEITTTPYRNLWVDRHEDTGTVDFTGFSALLHEFQRCQDRLFGRTWTVPRSYYPTH